MSREQDGVLVVEADGAVSWWSRRAAAVGEVDLLIAAGIGAQTDAARSDMLLAWTIRPEAEPGPLAAAVGDPVLAEVVDELRRHGERVCAYRCPPLVPVWRRRALVAAIGRWTMRPVHSGAFLLDEAVAEKDLGHDAVARRLFGYAEAALLDLGERCAANELPGEILPLLRRAATDATVLGVGDDGLVATLADLDRIDDQELLRVLGEWSQNSGTAGAVPVASALDASVPGRETDSYPLDPAVLPPRIVAWHGARASELLVEHRRARDVFVVSAALAERVDPTCRELAELLAYAVHRNSGRVLAVAPIAVQDNVIQAELPAQGARIGALVFGLCRGDVAAAAARCGSLGRTLIDIDRRMLDGWNQHRAALAKLSAAGASGGRARAAGEMQWFAAAAAVRSARRQLRDLLESMTEETDPAVLAALRARRTAIDEYLGDLAGPTAVDTAELLLAELIPPDPAEL
ncbi:hypothetical protein [Nocardia macrotermitis]|uniref:Uncharacterized protein n=1 Tax=Nocardia macrotermitis TaxID=2585198 RepID=A0A7K0D342_9NOCA|nr:hypothetical protein [Nocardia macrotermitis]MQY20138.1 hypothetical protein [Nocardia macrotermitis]